MGGGRKGKNEGKRKKGGKGRFEKSRENEGQGSGPQFQNSADVLAFLTQVTLPIPFSHKSFCPLPSLPITPETQGSELECYLQKFF